MEILKTKAPEIAEKLEIFFANTDLSTKEREFVVNAINNAYEKGVKDTKDGKSNF